MNEPATKGVIFDLDGTLYTLRWMKLRMSLALFGSVGVLKSLSGARSDLREKSFADRDALLKALYEGLSSRAGIGLHEARDWYQDRFMAQFVALLGRKGKVREGLAELLEDLSAAGVKLAVVSDFDRVRDRLIALKIDPDMFVDLAAAEDYGVLKPMPEPMLDLARKWDIPAAQVTLVGDRADLDAECAKRAGMNFIGLSESGSKPGREDFVDWNAAAMKLRADTGNRRA